MSSETNTQSNTLGTQMHSGMALLGIGGSCAPRMGRIFFIKILLSCLLESRKFIIEMLCSINTPTSSK
jgi:hypothetical protein